MLKLKQLERALSYQAVLDRAVWKAVNGVSGSIPKQEVTPVKKSVPRMSVIKKKKGK